ncbi:MAG: hypothetical protein PHS82_11360 [Lachnospiraceae bacterium]|nr:hypothetical protein [Lachnospiraceae bacterium]
MIWIIIIIILHFICIAVLYMAGKNQILRMDIRLLPVLFWLPILGECCAVMVEAAYRLRLIRQKEIGMEKMQYNDRRHQNLLSMDEISDEEVVPAEEAFRINESKMRRELILDLLKKDPKQYIGLLQEARMNDDVDVVHYAATAIMELNNEYDIRIQEMEHLYANDQEDQEVLEAYIELLHEYLEHKLIEGQRLQMIRNQYSQLLQKKIAAGGTREDYRWLIDNELQMEHYEEAYEAIQQMKTRWPGNEEPWLLLITYYAKQKKGKDIRQVIRQMQEQDIYLSSNGKEVVEFWKTTD